MASKHHCGQAFSTYLGGWEGRSPVRREGVRGAAPQFLIMIFCRFLEKSPRSFSLRDGQSTTFLFIHFPCEANTQAGWNHLFFSVPVFTTGLVTVICLHPPHFGVFAFFSSPWSRVISFFVRVYYSGLSSQTVYTVLMNQCSLHEPVLWTSSIPSPGYFSIPSDWLRVPNV